VTAARERLAALRWELTATAREGRTHAAELGWPAAVALAGSRLFGGAARPRRPLWPLPVRGFPNPVYHRSGSSDALAVRQVFGRKDYASVGAEPGVEFIVDLGANVGAAAAYLLHRYPRARLAAVEPDADNLRVCRRTLAPYADRVTLLRAGVWPTPGRLAVERGGFRDGREWAIRVRPAADGDCPALTVPQVLELAGFPRADVLKMDIEGAETELFAGDVGWLSRVRTLVIELHDATADEVVSRAVGRFGLVRQDAGEVTVFRAKPTQDSGWAGTA
jgi:FkbM family methyltransferase